jgi:hypothetical protein
MGGVSNTLISTGTHIPLLAACLARLRGGAVLECGVGHYSTPLIHMTAAAQGRRVLSLDRSREWLDVFAWLAGTDRRFAALAAGTTWPAWCLTCDLGEYALAFVDHEDGPARGPTVAALQGKAAVIVCHDTERERYNYEPALARFRHVRRFTRYAAQAAVVSDVDDLSWLIV